MLLPLTPLNVKVVYIRVAPKTILPLYKCVMINIIITLHYIIIGRYIQYNDKR